MKLKPYKINKNDLFLKALRILGYLEIVLICLVTAFCGSGPRPLLLIPFAIALSAWTDELSSAIIGFLCGFAIDIITNTLPGFNAFLLVVFCVIVSYLHIHLLRHKFINFLILNTLATFIQGGLWYLCGYYIWQGAKTLPVFNDVILKSMLETAVFAIPIYFIINVINRKVKPYQMTTIEEAVRSEYDEDDE